MPSHGVSRLHTHHGFTPYSMQRPVATSAGELWSAAGWYMHNVPAEVSCIVCFTETEGNERGLGCWHHCRVCSAIWCDPCMERMYYVARDEAGELRCPQCRGSIGDMQLGARIERVTENLGCADPGKARLIVEYENLLAELIHLCEAQADGMPHYTVAPEDVARIFSRAPECEALREIQGSADVTWLRRLLRDADVARAASMVLHGYAQLLRATVPAAAVTKVLRLIELYMREEPDAVLLSATPAVMERRAALRRSVASLLEEPASQPTAASASASSSSTTPAAAATATAAPARGKGKGKATAAQLQQVTNAAAMSEAKGVAAHLEADEAAARPHQYSLRKRPRDDRE